VHCVSPGQTKQWVAKMGMAKFQDYVRGVDYREPGFSEPENTKPIVLQSAEQMELETLLEELAEFIESEDGILIP
jgi:di/tripeptidase